MLVLSTLCPSPTTSMSSKRINRRKSTLKSVEYLEEYDIIFCYGLNWYKTLSVLDETGTGTKKKSTNLDNFFNVKI